MHLDSSSERHKLPNLLSIKGSKAVAYERLPVENTDDDRYETNHGENRCFAWIDLIIFNHAIDTQNKIYFISKRASSTIHFTQTVRDVNIEISIKI